MQPGEGQRSDGVHLVKHGAPDHHKMKALARKLGIPLPYANGIMERLWHATANYAPDGGIGRCTDEEIADHCRVELEFDPRAFIDALVDTKWLDRIDSCRLFVHDWPEHCDHYTHRKIARKKAYFADGTPPHLTRMSDSERDRLSAFYAENQHERTPETRETDARNAESGRPNQPNGRPKQENLPDFQDSKNTRTPETRETDARNPAFGRPESSFRTPPTRARVVPPPEPEPEPEPEPQQPVAKLANGDGRRRNGLSMTLKELRIRFADTTEGFAERLRTKARKAAKEGGSDPDLVTDQLLAQTIKSCTKRNQESAGLYLDTVPAVIRTLAETEEK